MPRGGFVSLLGPSGCGKSTLLRMVAGLLEPTAGRIDWPERPGRGQVGFVFQDPTLMPWATVADNVRLPLDLLGVDRREGRRRAAALIERVGLAGFEGAFPRQLSGGMRMRASLARALVTQPSVLLLDEPFAALDEITRQDLNDELLSLWAERRFTALFVTHSVYESAYLSTAIAVMAPRPGRIVDWFDVPLAHPRGRALRVDAGYAALCGRISASLAAAMGRAA